MVDRSARFREQLDIDNDESDAVLHETDRYAEVVLAAARPSGSWRLAWCTANEMEVVVRPAEDDASHQRPEAVQSHLRDGETIANLGDEPRELVGLRSDAVLAVPEGISPLQAHLLVAIRQDGGYGPRLGVRNRLRSRENPGGGEAVQWNRCGVLVGGHLDAAARPAPQRHGFCPALRPARGQPVLRPEVRILLGEQAVFDLPIDGSLAVPATCLGQD